MKNFFDRIAADHNDSDEPDHAVTEAPDYASSDTAADQVAGTSPEVKAVVQELLKHGFVEESGRAGAHFRRAMVHERAVTAALEPLDLVLRIDSHRGIVFLGVSQTPEAASKDEEEWAHPLVRRQRLTLEQSLLIAILRQTFVMHEQESGVGEGAAKISIDELLPQFLTYFGDSRSDAKNESRLLNLLDQLKTYGVVTEVDPKHEVTIRPLIAHLANPESLTALLQVLKDQAGDITTRKETADAASTDA